MISFRPLRETLQKMKISIYALEKDGIFGKATTTVLRTDNGNVNTKTLNAICNYLNCSLSDVAEYVKETDKKE